jgi:hypothetical protein
MTSAAERLPNLKDRISRLAVLLSRVPSERDR